MMEFYQPILAPALHLLVHFLIFFRLYFQLLLHVLEKIHHLLNQVLRIRAKGWAHASRKQQTTTTRVVASHVKTSPLVCRGSIWASTCCYHMLQDHNRKCPSQNMHGRPGHGSQTCGFVRTSLNHLTSRLHKHGFGFSPQPYSNAVTTRNLMKGLTHKSVPHDIMLTKRYSKR